MQCGKSFNASVVGCLSLLSTHYYMSHPVEHNLPHMNNLLSMSTNIIHSTIYVFVDDVLAKIGLALVLGPVWPCGFSRLSIALYQSIGHQSVPCVVSSISYVKPVLISPRRLEQM
jgi:hypothetical protein